MRIGYIRVSTEEQNTARQDALMKELDVERVYTDKVSGKKKDRPGMDEMMNFVREGDVVIVESISRFARSVKDLLDLVEKLQEKKVEFVSKKESIDTTTPQGRFMLTVFGAMAELEREQRASTAGVRVLAGTVGFVRRGFQAMEEKIHGMGGARFPTKF